jgi:hypothetical protein
VYTSRVAMGFVNTFTASGQGSLSLGGVQTVSEVAAYIVTFAPEATVVGVAPVRRVWHQCFFAIGLTASGGPTSGIFFPTFWKYLEVETESNPFATGDLRLADTIYWDVSPGGVMYFEVDWP